MLELLYHISHEIAATLDLSQVLQRVLSLAMENIGATSGSIIVLNSRGEPIESALVYKGEIIDHSTEQLGQLIQKGLAGWVIKNQKAVLVPDTSQDERWLQRGSARQGKRVAKSSLSAPFIAHESLVGVITLSHVTPHYFSEEHLSLVQSIANQAAVAVVNAHLYAASQHQVQVMSALANSASAITSSLKLSDVLQQILEQTSQALDVDIVSLALLDTQKTHLEYKATTVDSHYTGVGNKHKIGHGIAGWVVQNDESIMVPNVDLDPRFSRDVYIREDYRIKSIACAPIRVGGDIIGSLEAINPHAGSFTSDVLTVLNGLASLAGTAIRHAQLFEGLQAAHERYHDLFNNNIDPMFITNWKGEIIEANYQATLFSGYSKEMLQKNRIDNLHSLNDETVGENYRHIASKESVSYESILHTKSKNEIPIQVHTHSILIDEKEHLHWTFQDITNHKQVEQLREDLISMIYHDLRSPLSNVISSLDVLESILSIEDDSTIRSLLDIAMRSTNRIQRLTNSLLDINRLEAGQSITNIRLTNPNDLIQTSLEAILPAANSKIQEIICDTRDDLPEIEVDENMIQRVLINILENAIKYSPPDEKIIIGARSEGNNITFWIEDSGLGIPDEKYEQIFEKFVRLHDGTKVSGIGLGLAYCRLAVEGHNGRIWAEPAPQGGTRFVFSIPIKHQGYSLNTDRIHGNILR
ncbi:MAG: GAF domain-containing protein [Chloroflexi bacterium]|nr:GAF domain-containing protein [Chloroflexota bacterium]